MAAIFVSVMHVSGDNDNLFISGQYRVPGIGGGARDWTAPPIPFESLASAINVAISDAAIAQAQLDGFTVNPSDKKNLLGEVGGL